MDLGPWVLAALSSCGAGWPRLVHVCRSWTSQGELALGMPGPDLTGRDLALAHVGLTLDLVGLQT